MKDCRSYSPRQRLEVIIWHHLFESITTGDKVSENTVSLWDYDFKVAALEFVRILYPSYMISVSPLGVLLNSSLGFQGCDKVIKGSQKKILVTANIFLLCNDLAWLDNLSSS